MPEPGLKTVAFFLLNWGPPNDPNNVVTKINVTINGTGIPTQSMDLQPTELTYSTQVDVPEDTVVFSGTAVVTTYNAAGKTSAVTSVFSYNLSAPPPVTDLTTLVTFHDVPVDPTA